MEVGTTLKQITQNDFKKTILAKKNTTVLMKEKLFALSEKKRLKRRLSNDFKRINRSSDFRSKFKYILPTLMDFSKSFEPQLLATVLAKLIQKAKKQT